MKSESEMSDVIHKMIGLIEEERIRREIANELASLSLFSDPTEFKELLSRFIKFPDGIEALRNKWRIIYNNSKMPLELIEVLGQDEEIRLQMLSDVRYLIDYGKVLNAPDLALAISKIEGGSRAISYNFEELFEISYINIENVVIPMLQDDVGRQKFRDNFYRIKNKFLSSYDVEGFLETIKALKEIEEFKDIYEEYEYWAKLYDEIEVPDFNTLRTDNISKLLPQESEKLVGDIYAGDIKNREFANILTSKDREEKRIILQTVANGNAYKYKACGTSSFIIQAGDQVVKLGIKKRKFEVPYHPRIMMPYFRKKYSDNTNLEVFNYGDTKSAKITDQVLLGIYKELESAGIIWGDARKTNLVVLTKDNELPDFIASKEFNLFGFLKDSRYPTNSHQVLKKGDIVICDLDMLYVKGDPEYQVGLLDPVISDYLKSKKRKSAKEDFEH